jgi:hypothetical protein
LWQVCICRPLVCTLVRGCMCWLKQRMHTSGLGDSLFTCAAARRAPATPSGVSRVSYLQQQSQTPASAMLMRWCAWQHPAPWAECCNPQAGPALSPPRCASSCQQLAHAQRWPPTRPMLVVTYKRGSLKPGLPYGTLDRYVFISVMPCRMRCRVFLPPPSALMVSMLSVCG